MAKTDTDVLLLEAALIGFEQKKQQIDQKIAELRQEMGGERAGATARPSAGKTSGRVVSAAARRRMAAAQRKRWAVIKGKQPKTRRMSAAARKKIAAAQRKRWALLKAAKAKPASKKPARKVA
ncbi:MAG TPA: hypothetical protein VLX58_05570 [Bryobacteraceae bacterium]|nr:hypothetical protein [Bryobacteraceae bacterium]